MDSAMLAALTGGVQLLSAGATAGAAEDICSHSRGPKILCIGKCS